MNLLLYRTLALVIHALLNFIIISYLVNFDATGSWLRFAGFFIIVLLLLVLFIKHIISFISFLKSRS